MLTVPSFRSGQRQFDRLEGFAARQKTGSASFTPEADTGERAGMAAVAPVVTEPDSLPAESGFHRTRARDALTTLHENGRNFETTLRQRPGEEADLILPATGTFLKEQRSALTGRMSGSDEQSIFDNGFTAYAQTMMAKSAALQRQAMRDYQIQTAERQNGIFLSIATGGEALDDTSLRTLADMHRMNLGEIYGDYPADKRAEMVMAAQGKFYQTVMDQRLAREPSRLLAMLDETEIAGTLGDETVDSYRTRAERAVADARLREVGESWFATGLQPVEAEERAKTVFADQTERDKAVDRYWQFRDQETRTMVLGSMVKMAETHKAIVGDNNAQALESLRLTDPDLAAVMDRSLASMRNSGGRPSQSDYDALLTLTEGFDARTVGEQLREGHEVWQLCETLGGPSSAAYTLFARMYTGQATAEDSAHLSSLRTARDWLRGASGAEPESVSMSSFLGRYAENCRIYRDRHGYADVTVAEQLSLAEQTWQDEQRLSGKPEQPRESTRLIIE